MSKNKLDSIIKSTRQIKMIDIDSDFKQRLSKIPGVENLKLCFQCGTCTADCPIARYSEIYHPRKLLRMTQLGLKDRVLSSEALWFCAACFTCVDHCPQGVDIAGVLRALRNIAVKKGFMPTVFEKLTDNINKTGYAYRIPELRVKKRMEKGLPPLPKTNIDSITALFDLLDISKGSKVEKK